MNKLRPGALPPVRLLSLLYPSLHTITLGQHLGSFILFSFDCPRAPLNYTNSSCSAEMKNQVRICNWEGVPSFFQNPSPLNCSIGSGIIWGGRGTAVQALRHQTLRSSLLTETWCELCVPAHVLVLYHHGPSQGGRASRGGEAGTSHRRCWRGA